MKHTRKNKKKIKRSHKGARSKCLVCTREETNRWKALHQWGTRRGWTKDEAHQEEQAA